MTKISPAQVKELREKTQAGMMDCKKALQETDGNFEEAVTWLKKKGLSAAQKKSANVAADGLVGVMTNGSNAAIAEFNCQTDFAAKNEKFLQIAHSGLQMVLDSGNDNVENLLQNNTPGTSQTLENLITENIAVVGENIQFRRARYISHSGNTVCHYVHNNINDNFGKIAVLVSIKSDCNDESKVRDLGKKIAMHIAATKPEALTSDTLDQVLVQKERDIFSEQAKASGKPESIIEKMVEGRIRKFYEEVVLLEQVFVMDGKAKVKEVIADFAKEHSCSLEITDFVCYVLGEGIEKKEEDFAAEVAAATKQ